MTVEGALRRQAPRWTFCSHGSSLVGVGHEFSLIVSNAEDEPWSQHKHLHGAGNLKNSKKISSAIKFEFYENNEKWSGVDESVIGDIPRSSERD